MSLDWIAKFPLHVVHWQVALVATVFFVCLVRSLFSGGSFNLENASLDGVLQKALAAAAFPTGVFLFWCAFDTSAITKAPGVELYLAVAGCGVLWYSVKEILKAIPGVSNQTTEASPAPNG